MSAKVCMAGLLAAGSCLADAQAAPDWRGTGRINEGNEPRPSLDAPRKPAPNRGVWSDSAHVLIKSVPSFYDVFLNGEPHGTTPMNAWVQVPQGRLNVSLKHPDRKPFDTSLVLERSQRLEVKFRPEQYPDWATRQPSSGSRVDAVPTRNGYILVHSRPPGADLHLNDEPAGKTPNRLRAIPSGPVRIRLFHPLCPSFDTTIDLAFDKYWQKNIRLDRGPGACRDAIDTLHTSPGIPK